MTGNITIDFEKKAHIASALTVIVSTILGGVYWCHSMYLEVRDGRIANQRTVQLMENAVKELTQIVTDHEKRITINSYQIEELRKRGE